MTATKIAHLPTDPTPEAEARPILVSLDPRQIRPREWLWRNVLPIGKFVGVEGEGDVGKTFALCDLVARIVRGDPMPDGSAGRGPGAVLWITDEEGEEELERRLLAAGLNPNTDEFQRVGVLSAFAEAGRVAQLELPGDQDLVRLAAAELQARGGVPLQLILIDPLFQYLEGDVNENSAKQVRKACAPLAPLARELGVCMAGLRHWNKMRGQARKDRGAGSAQISSTFRIQISVFRHPEEPALRVFSADMNRYVADDERVVLGFKFVPVNALESARVEWVGETEVEDARAEPGAARGPSLQDEVLEVLDALFGPGVERVALTTVLESLDLQGVEASKQTRSLAYKRGGYRSDGQSVYRDGPASNVQTD